MQEYHDRVDQPQTYLEQIPFLAFEFQGKQIPFP